MEKIKILIVDDSAVMRSVLAEILSSDDDIEVVGTAMDASVARDKIKSLNPDLLTLDVEMPEMDGLSFLRQLMQLHPMPVVMISTLTEAGADVTLKALGLGAIDFISKPKFDVTAQMEGIKEEIISKIKAAAKAKPYVSGVKETEKEDGVGDADITKSSFTTTAVLKKHESKELATLRTNEKIIAIGGSTGGTEAIKDILMRMAPDSPAILIVQHIPPAFSKPFSERMNDFSPMNVRQAEDGLAVLPGNVYIAPGDSHLMLTRNGTEHRCKLHNGLPVNRHKPSVDVMFRSVAQTVGTNAIGVLLTGMGRDGARGLREIRETGAKTIAQDEESSVIWGMPGAAVKLDAVDYVLPNSRIADKIYSLLKDA